jgi:exosome complex protein LRP1
MDVPVLTDHLDDLSSQIDALTTALSPLTSQPLLTTASTLPLLDKAKLYILLSYAIESLLYSSLLTAGLDAKAHPVFAELARLKTYFQKLKDAERGPEAAEGKDKEKEQQPKTRIDKDAVGRFVRAGLSGNDKFDRERAEQLAKERARAALRAKQMGSAKKAEHIKFDDKVESARMEVKEPRKRSAEEEDDDEREERDSEDIEAENEELYGADAHEEASSPPPKKKIRVEAADLDDDDDDDGSPSTPSSAPEKPKKQKRSDKSTKRRSEMTPEERQADKAARRERKASRREKSLQERHEKAENEPETVLPAKNNAPRTHSETFKALLEGPLKKKKNEKKSKRK